MMREYRIEDPWMVREYRIEDAVDDEGIQN
jgi:hypothetical protein